MKHLTLPLVLALVACGGEEAADTAGPGDSAVARIAPDFDVQPERERATMEPGTRTVEADRDDRRGLTVQKARTGNSATLRQGNAPDRRVEITDRREVQPRAVALPTDPFDENLSVLVISTDTGADGTIDRVQRSTFDSASHRILLEEDRDGDGVFEVVQAFAHFTDDQNRVIRVETDDGADGTVDSSEDRIFGANGRALRVEHDEDGDGTIDKIEKNTWNADGRKTSWTVDEGNDGTPDMVQRWAFANGAHQTRSLERYTNGALTRTTRYENVHNDDGKLVTTIVDLQGDGSKVNHIDRVYDDNGRIWKTQSDIGNDGSIDSATSYTYDANGRLHILEIDSGADGTPDTRITRTYEGFRTNDCFGR